MPGQATACSPCAENLDRPAPKAGHLQRQHRPAPHRSPGSGATRRPRWRPSLPTISADIAHALQGRR